MALVHFGSNKSAHHSKKLEPFFAYIVFCQVFLHENHGDRDGTILDICVPRKLLEGWMESDFVKCISQIRAVFMMSSLKKNEQTFIFWERGDKTHAQINVQHTT